jgi:formylglycine-generating enzyme required for sulfatase activity
MRVRHIAVASLFSLGMASAAVAQSGARAPAPLSPAEEKALKPGDVFRECATCREMVVIPAGSFVMGSPANEPEREISEGPTRKVTIRQNFAVGKFELTIAEFEACVRDKGCGDEDLRDDEQGRGDEPVVRLRTSAKAYVAWLSRKTGKRYRLLTEAEWEYAARAGTTSPFAFGNTITPDQANYYYEKGYAGGPTRPLRNKMMPVGSFPANSFGLHDMHGNADEWVEDCWIEHYRNAPTDGTARSRRNCEDHVTRGGSWSIGPQYARSAARGFNGPATDSGSGFRIARSLAR